jgi:TDG/mug DNA glycosylase family protein
MTSPSSVSDVVLWKDRGMPELVAGQSLPDILDHGLNVVFCGLNPGMDAAAAGHHFLGRGNRFWPVLHLAGFTPHQIAPHDDKNVLRYGLGLTVAAARPTRRGSEIAAGEYARGASALLRKLHFYRPRYVAFLGKAAYLAISGGRQTHWGHQDVCLGGTSVWVLPNPSGLNRGFSLEGLVDAYAALRVVLSQ